MTAPLNTSTTASFICIPFGVDPLEALAKTVIQSEASRLPDLSSVIILSANRQTAPSIRRQLLREASQHQCDALLGPHIMSREDWAQQHLPTDINICHPQAKELLLIEALLQHPELFGGANPWSLAESLLQLFDELNLNQVELPEGIEQFKQQLARAYALEQDTLSPFSKEARLIHTLWTAWHEQLQENGRMDDSTAYLLALQQSLKQNSRASIYILADYRLTRAEQSWLRTLMQQQPVTVFIQGHPDTYRHFYKTIDPHWFTQQELVYSKAAAASDYSRCLDAIYADEAIPLLHRAEAFSRQCPTSPLTERLSVYAAENDEAEARAVDIQVRQWLLAGRQNIGIVTENRRLARRVRALLERAGVVLQDAAGWALSTTSAATAVEALLQCIEEDFSHIPFLDLLKCRFIFHDIEANCLDNAIFRLEQDIILQENIARGLARYRSHFRRRQARLPEGFATIAPALEQIFDRLQAAAEQLTPLTQGTHPPHGFITALLDVLHMLHMHTALEADAAGRHILQLFEQLATSTAQHPLPMDWMGFRNWLGRQLERAHFKPGESGSPVKLISLSQTPFLQFDALILAGAEQEYLPGQAGQSPFFNQGVRHELGLTTLSEQWAEGFYYYRGLLESAGQILITLRKEQDGEVITASPWLETLQSFHQLAYGAPLGAAALEPLVHDARCQVVRREDDACPAPLTQPRPITPGKNIPTTISASDYQLLLDCPYHYFASRILKLSAPEAIRELLAKADYGQRIHQCLQAFHTGVKGLPGPFSAPISSANRAQAIELLEQISTRLFEDDLLDNFAHRSWYYLWQSVIPAYVDWQGRRNQQWRVAQTERQYEHRLSEHVSIKGRLDRIDQSDKDIAILDYKTGATPSLREILAGEAVQLPFYALLINEEIQGAIQRVEYLKLDDADKLETSCTLEGEQIEQLGNELSERLTGIMAQLHEGAGLPAWPDDKSCSYCDMQTLCRRQVWQDS